MSFNESCRRILTTRFRYWTKSIRLYYQTWDRKSSLIEEKSNIWKWYRIQFWRNEFRRVINIHVEKELSISIKFFQIVNSIFEIISISYLDWKSYFFVLFKFWQHELRRINEAKVILEFSILIKMHALYIIDFDIIYVCEDKSTRPMIHKPLCRAMLLHFYTKIAPRQPLH